MKNIFIILLLIFVMSSCSKQQKGKTLTQFSVASFTAGSIPGGMLIFGYGSNGEKFNFRGEGLVKAVSLTSGVTWTFGAIGWEGATPFTGAVKCAVSAASNLVTETFSVNLTLTTDNCSHPIFGLPESKENTYEPKLLQFHSCVGLSTFSTLNPYGPPDCSELPGAARSFKIAVYEFAPTLSPFGNMGAPLESTCVGNIALGDSSIPSTFRIPLFDSLLSIPIIVTSYDGNDCTGTPSSTYFANGPELPALDAYSEFKTYSTHNHVLLESNICTGNYLTNSPFAQGAFDSSGVNYICTPAQLMAIDTNSSTLSGNYILMTDLNMSVVTSMIGGNPGLPFTGEFSGNYKTISNYSLNCSSSTKCGLFAEIRGARITELLLTNFTLNSSTSTYTGALVGLVSAVTSPTGKNEISRVNLSIATISTSVAAAYTGGLVGYINYNSASPGEMLFLRKNHLSDVLINNTSTTGVTGGLVGRIMGAGNSYLSLEFNYLSDLTLTGVSMIGGIVGEASYFTSRNDEVYLASITGESYLGGMVGNAGFQVKIERPKVSELTMKLLDTGANDYYYGGVAGYISSGSIGHAHVSVSFGSATTPPASSAFNYIGGIIGKNAGTSSNTVIIRNCYAEIESNVNGAFHGGIAGHLDFSAPASTISQSKASGFLNEVTQNAASNFIRGGIAGQSGTAANTGVTISQSYSDVDIDGYTELGGVVGLNEGGNIYEVVSAGSITGYNLIGGLLGSAVGGQITDGQSSTVLTGGANCTECGKLFGYVEDCNGIARFNRTTGNTLTINLVLDSTLVGCGHANPADCVNPNPVACSDTDIVTASPTCTDLFGGACAGAWESINGYAELKFLNQWSSFSLAYAGNYHDPFPIYDCSDWNSISNNSFLLKSAFIFMNDIDCSGGFIPIGGEVSTGGVGVALPFEGAIIANGYSLNNVEIIVGEPMDYVGVIRVAGSSNTSALIGEEGFPLRINMVGIETGSHAVSGVGAIGLLSNGSVSMQVTNADYSGSSTTNTGGVGGIAGIFQSGMVSSSSFEGSINFTYLNNIGGFIGKAIAGGASGRSVFHSYAKTSSIVGNDAVGGFIGLLDGGLPISISNSYAHIGGTINSPGICGGFNGSYSGGGTSMIQNSFVYIAPTATFCSSGSFVHRFGNGLTTGIVTGGYYISGTTDAAITGVERVATYDDLYISALGIWDFSRAWQFNAAGEIDVYWKVIPYE